MDLRQLQALTAVADHGSFSAAADALLTVQSNVSAHVAKLEKELGVVLVDRAQGRLTPEGEAVVLRARRIEAELAAAAADVAAISHEVRGTVSIGVIGSTARWLVPHLLGIVGERHPALRLVVVEGTTASLEPRLASGALDLAVVNLPVPTAELAATSLFQEDLVLVVQPDHPLAGRSSVALEELPDLPLLLPPRGSAFRDELDRAVVPRGLRLRPLAELDGIRLIASLAFEGHGPAVLPASAVPPRFAGQVRLLPVDGLPRRRVGTARRRRGLPSAPTKALVDVLPEVVRRGAETQPGIHPL